MSVILEFTIDPEEFALGRALAGTPDVTLEIERIIPTRGEVMPFVWVTGEDHSAFEAMVRESDAIAEFRTLDRVGDSALYRVEWVTPPADLIMCIARSDATVLEAVSDGTWMFRLRFPDYDGLTAFNDYCSEHGLSFRLRRTYKPSEYRHERDNFGLTDAQYEALVLAFRRGYFETPKAVELGDLAVELGISRQAVSSRIRAGNEKLLERVLLDTPRAGR